MDRPVISFITDFGGRDPSAAICRGVMLGICRDAQIVDITHDVTKWAVREAAYLLRNALPHMPVGVHVGVIDPGVGTSRRPVAVRVGRGDVLVGPDNGLLVPVAEKLGGPRAVRLLENRALFHGETTSTFHGRDIFAPVAAHLAVGVAFEDVGPAIDPADLVRLPWPGARISDGLLETGVVYVDSFGNLKLDVPARELEAALGPLASGDPVELELRDPAGASSRFVTVPWARTFGERAIGELLIYADSFHWLSVAGNQANAAARLGIGIDQPVAIRRATAQGGAS